jgi:hypothetical protein
MFELKRTHARTTFKDLLGQANHFLITILVGLNSVRKGDAKIDEEFRTTWNPQDARRSAERSRSFVLDLALIRAVDALDSYMMQSRRRPYALTSLEFSARMDGTGQKISKRLEVFCEFLKPLPAEKVAFLKLAIDWRNRRVHSLAEEMLERSSEEELLRYGESLRTEHSGLDVEALLKHYKTGESPSFKEAASIIRLTHNAVAHFDAQLLLKLDIERYVRDALQIALTDANSYDPNLALKRACAKIWGSSEKKYAKVVRALRLIGVHPTSEITACQVPDSLLETIVAMTPTSAYTYLTDRNGSPDDC